MNDTPVAWATERVRVAGELAVAGIAAADAEARWLTEHVSGHAGTEWVEIERSAVPERLSAQLDRLVARRVAGEPLQYVLGSWSFRSLELMVDRRVLVPRPETEWVVEIALREAERLGLRRGGRPAFGAEPTVRVADLGTGSGAIALSLEAELPDAEVWAVDRSPEALEVARLNALGCSAHRIRMASGSWFDALPAETAGSFVLLVSNPPYVSADEYADLPTEVRDHEPHGALVSGPTGNEDVETLLRSAPQWLVPGGVMVVELAPQRAEAARAVALDLGYAAARIERDLTGRDRMLVVQRAE